MNNLLIFLIAMMFTIMNGAILIVVLNFLHEKLEHGEDK